MSSSNLAVSSLLPPSPSPAAATVALPKPTQVKFYRAAQMALFAHIAVFPPLGQVTVASPSRDPVSLSSPACIRLDPDIWPYHRHFPHPTWRTYSYHFSNPTG